MEIVSGDSSCNREIAPEIEELTICDMEEDVIIWMGDDRGELTTNVPYNYYRGKSPVTQ